MDAIPGAQAGAGGVASIARVVETLVGQRLADSLFFGAVTFFAHFKHLTEKDNNGIRTFSIGMIFQINVDNTC